MIDLDAYFRRIDYHGPRTPTLDVLHAVTAAHTMAIPFENLNILLGRPIVLDRESLFQKLVTERRGGYCFEQNGLFLHVLEALGFVVTPLSARVRLQRPRDYLPPRTHLFLRVDLDRGGARERWITDVGVGGASLTSAIRFDTEVEQATAHEPRRIVREGDVTFHQVRYGDTWNDVYELTGESMPPIDRTLANWYTSTHPESHFRSRLIAARALPEGRRVSLLDRELTLRERDGTTERRTIDSADELLEVLDASFGLRFPAGTRFRAPDAAPDSDAPAWPI